MSAAAGLAQQDPALHEAWLLLRSGRTQSAQRQLRALAARAPPSPSLAWLLGAAALDLGELHEARRLLAQALASAPRLLQARIDHARACRAAGEPAVACEQLHRVLEAQPRLAPAWMAYGDALVDLGNLEDARIAFERARECDAEHARIEAATRALLADDRRSAEGLFRQVLMADPAHVPALCGLAAISLAADVPGDAERLLRHALRQSPHVPLAWRGLCPALVALGRLVEASDAAAYLRRIEPDSAQSWITTAATATRLLRQDEALAAYRRALELRPGEVRLHTSIGHLCKTLGRRAESEAAYKAAIATNPGHAEAWWSLADLKNYDFTTTEVAAMEGALADAARDRKGDAQLHFALGKACEQHSDHARAFDHYARGNALRRQEAPFDAGAFEHRSARIAAFCDRAWCDSVAGHGDPSRAPIFIVGLPRSGSTLVEQILASHPEVEGTMELPNVLNYVREVDDLSPTRDAYPEGLAAVPVERYAALGARYLAETAPLRQGRARFIDKLPNNFSHVGLIHAMLPNATIIDVRRDPMDCCLSNFRQHYAEGQAFSYDLADLARYYRAYLGLMDHWDAVLPGKVLRVQYERVVHEPEAQVRRLLAHCGLGYDPACLAFHETRRPVRTASAEQVRQPLYATGIGYWKRYETQLAPLAAALGDARERAAP